VKTDCRLLADIEYVEGFYIIFLTRLFVLATNKHKVFHHDSRPSLGDLHDLLWVACHRR